jgi:hypothetical protein
MNKHRGRPAVRAIFQPLEPRLLRAVGTYSYDGTGNNLTNPQWGSVNEPLLRLAPAAYTDGISTPAGADRPSARLISDELMVQRGDDIFNNRQLSDFAYAWGQLVDHDMDFTDTGDVPFNIPVPDGDPQFDPDFTGDQVIPMDRSLTVTGTGVTTPLQQPNEITGFLDGSVIYGSDPTRAAALRTFSGGMLKTSAGDLMPFNTEGLPNETEGGDPATYFLGGDVRANENSEFTALNTLLVRNHNRLAAQLAQMYPTWDDEQLYQEARTLNIATIQEITYNEFLPALMGTNAMPAYTGYDPNVDPDVSVEFSAAAFRVGHTMLGNDVQFFDDQGNTTAPDLKLSDIGFDPSIIEDNGIDSLIKYLATNNCEEVDLPTVDSVRNQLFGLPGQGGEDLAAIDIQRGRDEGLPDYNTERVALGLPAVTSFAQITSNVSLQQTLQSLYGNVTNIDLYVGGLAEDHLPGSSLGPTFQAIIVNQFTRTRAGDRLWYQNSLAPWEMSMVQGMTLTQLIEDNTTLRNIQPNSFFFDAELTGTVFSDINGNGVQDAGESPLADQYVYLQDDDANAIIASTTTDANGYFAFKDVQVGTYSVVLFIPSGYTVTTPAQGQWTVTKGEIFANNNFGLQKIINLTGGSGPILLNQPDPGPPILYSPPPASPADQLTDEPTGLLFSAGPQPLFGPDLLGTPTKIAFP